MSDKFSFFPIRLLQLALSEQELRVMVALYSFRDKNANTVWPSTPEIAERSGIRDVTRISKVTKRLVEMGLITKRKRGFAGGNVYGFLSEDEESTNLAESANLVRNAKAKSSNLAESANLEKSALSNLAESALSNLAESAKCKELTNELTNEHTRELGSPPAQRKHADAQRTYSKRNADVQRTYSGCRLPDDWTPDVVFAASNGMSELDALTEAERFRDYWRSVAGAKGRKSDWQATWRNWIRRAVEQRQSSRTPPDRAGSHVSFAERHTDQSWRVGL